MTGSQQFPLMKSISETLAGRIAILELMPFSIRETKASKEMLEDNLWTGQYPEPASYPDKREHFKETCFPLGPACRVSWNSPCRNFV